MRRAVKTAQVAHCHRSIDRQVGQDRTKSKAQWWPDFDGPRDSREQSQVQWRGGDEEERDRIRMEGRINRSQWEKKGAEYDWKVRKLIACC